MARRSVALTLGLLLRISLRISLGLCLLAWAFDSAAEPAAAQCTQRECVAFVNDKPAAAQALCDDAAVTIRWTAGSNVFLTTCEDAGTLEQSTHFLSDAAGNEARELVYGRAVFKQFLRLHPTGPVPDKFAARPYCTPVSLRKLSASTFVLLEKQPANTENGYCYEPTYVNYDQGTVTVDTAKTRIAPSDENYFGPSPTDRQRSSLAALIRQYGPMSDQSGSSLHENPGRIAAERAYLYGKPEESGKTKAYLISGDRVAVLEEVGAWTRIRYRRANGNEIIDWVRSADVRSGS